MHPTSVALQSVSWHADVERLVAAHDAVRTELLNERTVGGHWVGELSSSPLATATAVSALVMAHGNGNIESLTTGASLQHVLQGDLSELIVDSLMWLAERQNPDGGWSDTDGGRSSVAAAVLVQSAFRLTCVPAKHEDLTDRADEYLEAQGGIAAIKKRYGRDKSLAAPILANAALAGMIPWRQVPTLPFEYLLFPQEWYRHLQLPVVSNALPVLAATGLLKFHHDPPRNPISRVVRLAARKRTLALLERLQPASGGFMESTPLTAFVVMSLASMGCARHRVVERGVEFLLASVRSDASWPVVTNLATWNTSLALDALASDAKVAAPNYEIETAAGETVSNATAWQDTVRVDEEHPQPSAADVLDENCIAWLLDCQRYESLPHCNSRPGGWAWTDQAGGIPETDDTAAALVALAATRHRISSLKQHRLQLAARRGVEWLVELQNDDGGWPTFCKGWNMQAFDRSAIDPTALAIRALADWQRSWHADRLARTADLPPAELNQRMTDAIERAIRYLENEQRNDGSFVPLWFGNQHHPEGHNLVYGTARVLIMCAELGRLQGDMAQRAARWLLGVQHANGGWGPPRSSPSTTASNVYRSGTARAEDALAGFCSVEETALAVEALLPLADSNQLYSRAVRNGLKWLVEAVELGRLRQPAPIGFYFAKLWYRERLYPLVFAASALKQAVRQVAVDRPVATSVG